MCAQGLHMSVRMQVISCLPQHYRPSYKSNNRTSFNNLPPALRITFPSIPADVSLDTTSAISLELDGNRGTGTYSNSSVSIGKNFSKVHFHYICVFQIAFFLFCRMDLANQTNPFAVIENVRCPSRMHTIENDLFE